MNTTLRTCPALSLPGCRYEAVKVPRRGTSWELARYGETGQRTILACSTVRHTSKVIPFTVTGHGRAFGLGLDYTLRACDLEVSA